MVFSSTIFLFLFLPGLLLLYYLPTICGIWKTKPDFHRKWKNGLLLIFSLVFYAWAEPIFVFVLILYVLINWFLVLRMEESREHKKIWMTTAIMMDVSLLVVFKYASFVSENIATLLHNDRLILHIALPLGISFFTFQLMSYVFDVYYGKAKAQRNPLRVGLYICLFPQLIAGPIVRYRQIENEIISRRENFTEIGEGIRRFVYGLAKKVLLANFLAQIADNYFDYYGTPSVMFAWLGAIAYTLQIYFDFSGYSDMAIGLGRMFGFHFLENFNYPYMARSVTEFWRRWHISLSTWFRDYIYIPLGGDRVNRFRWLMNQLTVWLLTGIWHGANWAFVIWGLFYFAILVFEKMTELDQKKNVLSHAWTLLIVILAWVIFRSDNISSGFHHIGMMFGIGADGFAGQDFINTIKNTYVIFALAIIGITPLISGYFKKAKEKGIGWIEYIWLTIIFIASIIEVVSSTYNPFIYFNF